MTDAPQPQAATEPLPPILVREYRGHEQSDALPAYRADALQLALLGYRPVTQSWAEGQWNGPQVIIAIILLLFIVGIFLVAYMLITRPDGALAVTYILPTIR